MVSGGTLKEQREVIARVATTFFGSAFTEDQIVTETIIRSLSTKEKTKQELRDSISQNPTEVNENFIRDNALVQWIEQKIALTEKEGIIVRNKPKTLKDISSDLSNDAELDKETSLKAIFCSIH